MKKFFKNKFKPKISLQKKFEKQKYLNIFHKKNFQKIFKIKNSIQKLSKKFVQTKFSKQRKKFSTKNLEIFFITTPINVILKRKYVISKKLKILFNKEEQ